MVGTSAEPTRRAIERMVAERVDRLFGQRGPLQSIRVERKHTVYVARCTFPSGEQVCVVKHHRPVAGSLGVELDREVHQTVTKMSGYLRGRTVRFLDVDPEHDLVFMEYVKGPSLEDVLSGDPPGDPRREVGEPALRQIANVLRRMHALETGRLPIDPPGRSNGSYRRQLEKLSQTSPIVRRAARQGLGPFLERFPAEFWAQVDERLNFGDLQAKNVLLRPDGRICVIDIGYVCGHPAQNVAFVMLSLDALALRRPSRARLERIARWKEIFLDEYLADREDRGGWVRRDLAFYYVRTLVTLGGQHLRRRRLAGPYLAWFYGRRLQDFLGGPGADSGRLG